jgi:hypothetical protein
MRFPPSPEAIFSRRIFGCSGTIHLVVALWRLTPYPPSSEYSNIFKDLNLGGPAFAP